MQGRVFRRGETWSFVVDLPLSPDGRRRQRKKGGFRTRKEAEAALASLLNDIQKGSVVETSRQSLAEYLDDWLASVAPSLRPTTAESYERAVRNWVVPRIGGMRLQAVTPQVLQRLYTELSTNGRQDGTGGLGPRSVKLAHTVLHLALGRAAAWRMIPANPAAMNLDLPRQVRREMTTWTPEEARRFLHANADDRLAALWVLMLATGLRRGEALGLRWDCLDLDEGRLSVTSTLAVANGKAYLDEPKTRESRRVVRLDAHVTSALRAHRSRQAAERLAVGGAWNEGNLVFTTPLGGWLHPQNLRRSFESAVRRAGVRRIRVHDLRHTAATMALTGRAHPKQVQEMLGHADVSITLDVYSHVSEDMHRDVAERIGRLLFSDATP
jgi:integrase